MKTSKALQQLIEYTVRKVVRNELSMLKEQLLIEMRQTLNENHTPQVNPYRVQNSQPSNTNSYADSTSLNSILHDTMPITQREALNGVGHDSIAQYVDGVDQISEHINPPAVTSPQIVKGTNNKPIRLDTPQSQKVMQRMFGSNMKEVLQKAEQYSKSRRGIA